MNTVSIQNQQLNDITPQTSNIIFSPENLMAIQKFAEVMAQGVVTVPRHLQGKPADCLAVVLHATQWGMNPFSVAQKTHLVNGILGYEAQLVNAAIMASGAIQGHFKYEYIGNWEQFNPTKADSEVGLACRVGAILKGDNEITWGEPVYLALVGVRNSPLWKTNPRQQIAYLAVKYWARLYTPGAILGIYTPDELADVQPPKDVTPVKPAQSLLTITEADVTSPQIIEEVVSDHQNQEDPIKEFDERLLKFCEHIDALTCIDALDKALEQAKLIFKESNIHLTKAHNAYVVQRDSLIEMDFIEQH
ncbi:RecT family recombinase [Thorsellia anophelis]|uniref:RecT family protein n=1 Tax=Thorsellia anophelis DSM 18579 TaxID=1123402 RepID=A0A1I0CC39_9GAMM|nr:RecT family recombinase [Thorsellia anophelis]SET16685.1 RecT family protein [Thorsellia anophelis DSM 18579]